MFDPGQLGSSAESKTEPGHARFPTLPPARSDRTIMVLHGDLETLDLSDLLQNLETHKRTGMLSIESEEQAAAPVLPARADWPCLASRGAPSSSTCSSRAAL